MSDIQKEIKDALEKATPGPWTWRKKKWDKGDGEYKAEEFNIGELSQKANPGQSYNSIIDIQKNKHGQPDIYAWVEADAHLIVNAPTWLLHQQELIEQLQEREFNHYPIVIHDLESRIFAQQDLIAQKDAEIARLTEQRNRTLAEWGKTLDDAETLAAQLEKEESL